MAPAYKTSKQEIIEAALAIVEEKGLSALTARRLGKRLGLSSRPIYSFYQSMDNLKNDLLTEIGERFKTYLLSQQSDDSFLNMGLGQIRFAKEKPVLYRIILNEADAGVFKAEKIHGILIEKLKSDPCYSTLPDDVLKDVLLKMGIFTNGLAEAVLHKAIEDDSNENIYRLLSETGEAVILHQMSKIEQEGS
ncbi:MAG: helix-turn-helix domain containing protein [Spirochaetes bacterium]|jgi:AcrR family transcriptional regulator|nr:helix-turn-helix domain containing protein [Spirochaetota bacterium]